MKQFNSLTKEENELIEHAKNFGFTLILESFPKRTLAMAKQFLIDSNLTMPAEILKLNEN